VRRTVLLAGALALVSLPLAADSIVLTSGRVIEAEQAWIEGPEVRYRRDATIFAIPRELVARVEAAGGGAGLEDPDLRRSRERLAAGEPQEALRSARLALFRDPKSPGALVALGAAQLALGDFARARQALGDALALEPASVAALELLGDALAESGDFAAARERYEGARTLAPTPTLERKLEALRPAPGLPSSARYSVRFDGAADEPLGLAVVTVLDETWDDFERKLGFVPQRPVTVVLQTAKAFYDTTRAPGWVAAWNDGTIRVPVAGLDRPTPGLVRVLRHELSHSFVASRTGANCPTWLQEGLAQWLEGGDPWREDAALARIARSSPLPRLESLEEPFVGLSEGQALLAYAGSLSAVSYIVKQYGFDGVRRVIASLALGRTGAEALPTALGLRYADLQRSWEKTIVASR
jgi:tetratricopeptide (TPR) repeat protein